MTVTIDDLEVRLGRALTDAEVDQAQPLLDDVFGAVQIRTGQKFIQAEYVLRTRVKRGYVRLPQRPVNDVESVFDTDTTPNALEFTWDGMDRVYVHTTTRPNRAPVQVVDVTYDAGPEEVPSAIIGIVCSIAARALGVNPTEGSVTQESIDGYAYTIGSAGGARAYGILPAEASILDAFRRPVGNIAVAW
jgi:hypothetical protein